jgi:hypothetical protein
MSGLPWESLSLANVFVWIGIALCITQSAIFSGLDLAIFSISKLRLEVEAAGRCHRQRPDPGLGRPKAGHHRSRSFGGGFYGGS